VCLGYDIHKSCYVGGVPGTQCLDIAFGAQLLLEKALDDHSRGAIVSSDIRRFYDSICVLKVVRYLLSQGCPQNLCAAVLRSQMKPCIDMHLLGTSRVLLPRSVGGLT